MNKLQKRKAEIEVIERVLEELETQKRYYMDYDWESGVYSVSDREDLNYQIEYIDTIIAHVEKLI